MLGRVLNNWPGSRFDTFELALMLLASRLCRSLLPRSLEVACWIVIGCSVTSTPARILLLASMLVALMLPIVDTTWLLGFDGILYKIDTITYVRL
jgi:hypothetical protein